MGYETADESYLDPELEQAFQGDKRLHVRFDRRPVRDVEATKTAGRAIFKEVDYVTIMVPGDKDNIVERPASVLDKQRFAAAYERWRVGKDDPAAGTPLELLAQLVPPLLTLTQVEEFKYFKIRTAEQLVDMPDESAQKFMGIQQIKTRVRNHLETAKSDAPMAHLRLELEKRDNEMETMRRQLAELSARVNSEPEAAPPKRRGRPPAQPASVP